MWYVSRTHAAGFNGPENLVIRHNIIANSPHAGMYIQGSNMSMEIYGNLIVNSRYEGINFTSGLAGSFSARVYNNTFYHNYASSWGSAIRVYAGSADISTLAACRRGTNNGPSANETRRVFADRPTHEWVKTL